MMWVAYLGKQPMASFSSYYAAQKWTEQFGNEFTIREVEDEQA